MSELNYSLFYFFKLKPTSEKFPFNLQTVCSLLVKKTKHYSFNLTVEGTFTRLHTLPSVKDHYDGGTSKCFYVHNVIKGSSDDVSVKSQDWSFL